MDEYNINNIEKINSINFININNDKVSPDISEPIFNKINYLKSLNKINSYSTKKVKKIIKNSKNMLLNKNMVDLSMNNNNYNQRYNEDEIINDLYEMNRTNIPDLKINSLKYEGVQRQNNNINNNYQKQNIVRPSDKIKMNNINNDYNKILFKKFNNNQMNLNNINNQNNRVYNNKTITNKKDSNNNNNFNSFTDYSMDENSSSLNSKNFLYIKKINEYKKSNKQLAEKLNILTNNLKLKSNEIQNLQQKNQSLQNELYLIKVNNDQGKNNIKINNNEELKKILMQKNKIINDLSQKMKMMKKDMEDKNTKHSNLNQILTKKNMELLKHQKELIEKEKKIEELNLELNNQRLNNNQKNEKLNEINSELKNENEEKEKKIENLSKKINNLEIDLKGVKNDEKEYFFQNKKNLEIIEQKDKQIQQLNEQISQLNNIKKNDDIINKENQNKESDTLLRKIEDLTNENNKLSKYINTLNSQKSNISPKNYTIIANKYHKKLIWYLLYKKSSSIDSKKDSNDYNNYIWVKGTELKKEDLKNYNKYEDEKKIINELTECLIEKQKKLEMKEEKINLLDYKNQKLSSQLHNKTANIKGNNNNIFSGKQGKDNSNFANSFNTEAAENEKYKNLLDKLNDSNKRNMHLHNQVAILKEKLNEKDNLEKKFPHDMKDIDPQLIDSGFLDDDSFENKEMEITDLFNKEQKTDFETNININEEKNKNKITIENTNTDKNNKSNSDELNKAMDINNNSKKDDPFKESERKVDEFLAKGAGEEDDFDEVKMINKQLNFLKDEIKDYREKNKNLGNEIKELFSKIKCNDKNRKHIVQICQILNFQPAIIDQIISNKFKIDKDKGSTK